MNNKGQVLVVFVILLPIILLFSVFIIDYGYLCIEKRNINNNTYNAISYSIKNSKDTELEQKILRMLNKNIKDISKINFRYENDFIEIEVIKKRKPIFNKLIPTEIKVKYIGYIETKEIKKG